MLEETVKNLNYFWEEFAKTSISLQRPAVQIQLLSLFLSILLALVMSKWSWTQLKQRFPKLRQIDIRRTKFSWQQFGLVTVSYLLTPTLCLVTLSLPLIVIRQWGWPIGYLIAGKKILVIFLFYRLFLLSLYLVFPFKAVTYYRNRLFAPIFFLFVGGRILNWFFNLQQLSQISLIYLFGDPITLEVVFVIVAGLYFLIVITSLLEKMAI